MPGPSVDLLALLRPAQVSVTVAGHRFTLEAQSASHWLGAVARDYTNLSGIMPGLIADDDLDLMCDLIDTLPDIETRWVNSARMALQRGGGRDWWWTLHLCQQALGTWIYTNGMLLRQNVDATSMRFGDWLDACYTLYWQHASEEDRMTLDMKLSMRPKGVAVRQSGAQIKQMAAAFAAD